MMPLKGGRSTDGRDGGWGRVIVSTTNTSVGMESFGSLNGSR